MIRMCDVVIVVVDLRGRRRNYRLCSSSVVNLALRSHVYIVNDIMEACKEARIWYNASIFDKTGGLCSPLGPSDCFKASFDRLYRDPVQCLMGHDI